jgi:hypothetical protein
LWLRGGSTDRPPTTNHQPPTTNHQPLWYTLSAMQAWIHRTPYPERYEFVPLIYCTTIVTAAECASVPEVPVTVRT